MSVYQKSHIIRDVRIALDENDVTDSLLAADDIDTLTLDQIISSKIVEGIKRVHAAAPIIMLEDLKSFGDSVFWTSLNSGFVFLPDDFFRLVIFEMDDWDIPVSTAISADDPDYAKQRSRFKGVRGTPQKPVCAINIRPEGRVLEFFSCASDDAEVSCALYLPLPSFDDSDGIKISERCYDAAIYMIAGLSASAIGDHDNSNSLIQLSKSLTSNE